MTGAGAIEVYYDPYDFAIDDDPYPVWKRLRDEAPLYFNEKYNFFALSRYDDVFRELHNWEAYRSGRSTTMDIILAAPLGITGEHFRPKCTKIYVQILKFLELLDFVGNHRL